MEFWIEHPIYDAQSVSARQRPCPWLPPPLWFAKNSVVHDPPPTRCAYGKTTILVTSVVIQLPRAVSVTSTSVVSSHVEVLEKQKDGTCSIAFQIDVKIDEPRKYAASILVPSFTFAYVAIGEIWGSSLHTKSARADSSVTAAASDMVLASLGSIFSPHKVGLSVILRDVVGNGCMLRSVRDPRDLRGNHSQLQQHPGVEARGEEHLIQICYFDTHEQKLLKQQTAAGRQFRTAEYGIGVAGAHREACNAA
ncbi:hypothetical protein BU16DRAFT_535492 [Lophium mytilinum]|uniref:Uncharacterized protein n=1 Tax=Lophium mytilinum TaxID=390894 RepID=A0A6A6R2X9_9PEZI|nr:hypothetical protein BU16DRAFT_535492 [Lophium mytilinum]